jgi:L-asparaginase
VTGKKTKRRVLVLYTGGTFGMDFGAGRALTTPDLKPEELARRLRERVPELRDLAHCDVEIVLNRDSAHIGPPEWRLFAETILKRWKKYDGVVLLHGTDTMAYTASALSFLLRPCLKPVVITGAQRPLTALRSDARRNLISAVEIAAHGPRELVSQVSVFFDDLLFQGNLVRKRSASEFEAFESPQSPPLAAVGTEMRYALTRARKRDRARLLPEFSGKVALLHVTPGFPARMVRERVLPGLDGLVLVVFPSGTAPTHDPEFIRLLQDARKRGVPAVIVTEGHSGSWVGAKRRASRRSSYAAGTQLLSEGGYWAGTMTPECAYVKTAWILAQPGGARRFASLWKRDFAGEGG